MQFSMELPIKIRIRLRGKIIVVPVLRSYLLPVDVGVVIYIGRWLWVRRVVVVVSRSVSFFRKGRRRFSLQFLRFLIILKLFRFSDLRDL